MGVSFTTAEALLSSATTEETSVLTTKMARFALFPQAWVINAVRGLVKDKRVSTTGQFHRGFMIMFDSLVEPILTPLLDGLIGGTPEKPYTIVVTGHSQGGAMGLLAALYIAKRLNIQKNKKFKVIAPIFGSPTVRQRNDATNVKNIDCSSISNVTSHK